MMSTVDLHIHTTASDGTDTPAILLEKLRAAGIRTFAVTDHDTVEGAIRMAELPLEGLVFIPGIEFSCVSPQGKCHILGYGCDMRDAAFVRALETGRTLRREKLDRRLRHFREAHGIELTPAELDWLRAWNSPGKPHLARILVARGLAPDVKEAIRAFFPRERGRSDRIPAALAVEAIRASGGLAVWAHPLGGEGEPRLTEEEFSAQLDELIRLGIEGLECRYSRYNASESAFLRAQAESRGLCVSGGSDYHGGNKPDIALGQLSADGGSVAPGSLTALAWLAEHGAQRSFLDK